MQTKPAIIDGMGKNSLILLIVGMMCATAITCAYIFTHFLAWQTVERGERYDFRTLSHSQGTFRNEFLFKIDRVTGKHETITSARRLETIETQQAGR